MWQALGTGDESSSGPAGCISEGQGFGVVALWVQRSQQRTETDFLPFMLFTVAMPLFRLHCLEFSVYCGSELNF